MITGGGSGIGRELAGCFAGQGCRVLVAGRRRTALEATRRKQPDRIRVVVADVATPEGREALAEEFRDSSPHRCFLVHNAAIVTPLKPLCRITLEEWRAIQATNVEAPLFLTQRLLPFLGAGSRILHVSSGAAHAPFENMGAYCTSKAALHMMYQCLRDELRDNGIAVGSVRPGIVNTPMQETLRNAPPEEFPRAPGYRRLKEEGELLDPAEVARFLCRLLMEVDSENFSAKEWDIRDGDVS
ncbi:MAG: SDR family NAD(P)-dependent oxidoreductase [Opitutales bacterium]